MKLERFEKNKNYKKVLIITLVAVVLLGGGLLIYRTFALYEQNKTFDVLNGEVPGFRTKCDPNLNGAEPVIAQDLIPVVIDENGVVTKVAQTDENWYNYCEKKWANAVIKQNSYDALTVSNSIKANKNEGYVSFNGKDNYIDLGQGNHSFTNVSLAIRTKIRDLTKITFDYTLISNKTTDAGMSIYLDAITHKLIFELYNETTNQFEKCASDVIPNDTSKYYTIVGTYDGHVMNLYLNGELIKNYQVEGKIKTSSKGFFIGTNPDKKNYSYINIRQAGIFDRILSSEEIKKYFTNDIKIYNGNDITKYIDFTDREQEVGEVIPEGIIESYFVWIPKYKYKLFDLGTTYQTSSKIDTNKMQNIEIKFGIENTKDEINGECTTPGISEDSGKCKVGDFMTHPAFTSFGDITGFWTGKFETGYNGAKKDTFSNNLTNVTDSSKIIIKPNVFSWHEINILNAYQTSFNYQRDLDSHMMKNTEWGAVAYLTNSLYGRCKVIENGQTSCEEVTINNYIDDKDNFKTGYAAKNEPTTGSYEESRSCTEYKDDCNEFGSTSDITITYKEDSSKASTTGNITGIYDMSGGAVEYVMGLMEGEDNELNYALSGFTESTFPTDAKYYDLYKYGTSTSNYQRRILGDATGEMGPFEAKVYPKLSTDISSWYNDAAAFVAKTDENKFWINRGGQSIDGTAAGLFYFRTWDGDTSQARTFRVVLAFKNEEGN